MDSDHQSTVPVVHDVFCLDSHIAFTPAEAGALSYNSCRLPLYPKPWLNMWFTKLLSI